ncbi:MAG: ABC transporter ATP-binding protein [Ilumatobacteraceae bacterium]|nr:ABC transporter ATP-binding protein [Ilumatobacteraceae bacterium]
MTELFAVEDLKVQFSTPRGQLNAVRGITLSVRAGECLGIVGESGSGKTVLWRSAMGLLRGRKVTRTGSARLEGRELLTLTPKEVRQYWGTHIAMVFQDPMTALNPVRRIGSQFVEALIKRKGMHKDEAMARTIELLRLVRMAEPELLVRKYPAQLSGGMRQRVMIAMAIACEPKVLLADEPTTALDVTVQAQVLELLSDLREKLGMAMVIVTHDLGIVAGHTDRIAVLYAGEVVEMASTPDLFANTKMPYTEALLKSIPRIDATSADLMEVIDGAPPDPVAETVGCFFAPRCKYATDKCRHEHPELVDDGAGHFYRCFYPLGKQS